MSPEERDSRSRVKPYIVGEPMLKGTLNERKRVCGKPNCKCARGEKHSGLYLIRNKKGKTEQLYVPKEKEAEVRQWVRNWHEVQDRLDDISRSYWERLKRKD
jgi:hypothetical protein